MSKEEQLQEFDTLYPLLHLRLLAKTADGSVNLELQEMREILSKKGDDYSNEDRLSVFKNISKSVEDLSPEQVCSVFISTKIERLKNLIINNKKTNNESIKDNLDDLFVYCFLFKCLILENGE